MGLFGDLFSFCFEFLEGRLLCSSSSRRASRPAVGMLRGSTDRAVAATRRDPGASGSIGGIAPRRPVGPRRRGPPNMAATPHALLLGERNSYRENAPRFDRVPTFFVLLRQSKLLMGGATEAAQPRAPLG